MGEISAAFEEDPIGNIFQFIRFFTLLVIFLPAKIHPLAGYLIFLPLAIASLISFILKLFKSLLGIPIWKEQLCSAIDVAKEHSRNLVELKEYLKENFDIEMKIQNKNLSYLHPDKQKYCRGYKLGHAYTKEVINSEFERKGKT